MKLHWFLNERELFESEGEIPLVGQTVNLHDYTSTPPKGKKKYRVVRVDRSIILTTKDIRELQNLPSDPIERYYQAIRVFEKESEGGKVTGADLPFFRMASDVAEIHLVIDSIVIKPDNT